MKITDCSIETEVNIKNIGLPVKSEDQVKAGFSSSHDHIKIKTIKK